RWSPSAKNRQREALGRTVDAGAPGIRRGRDLGRLLVRLAKRFGVRDGRCDGPPEGGGVEQAEGVLCGVGHCCSPSERAPATRRSVMGGCGMAVRLREPRAVRWPGGQPLVFAWQQQRAVDQPEAELIEWEVRVEDGVPEQFDFVAVGDG